MIAQLILECQAPVGIVFADSRQYESGIYGQAVIELPTEERLAEKVLAWLKNKNVPYEKED